MKPAAPRPSKAYLVKSEPMTTPFQRTLSKRLVTRAVRRSGARHLLLQELEEDRKDAERRELEAAEREQARWADETDQEIIRRIIELDRQFYDEGGFDSGDNMVCVSIVGDLLTEMGS